MDKGDWIEKYKKNIDSFENRHERLFEMTNQAIEWIEKANHESIYEILAELTNNFNTLYSEEERVLKRLDYPELQAHKQAHKAFIKRMLYYRRGSEENSKNIAEEVHKFLNQWLLSHILELDKEYFSFIRVQIFLEARQS